PPSGNTTVPGTYFKHDIAVKSGDNPPKINLYENAEIKPKEFAIEFDFVTPKEEHVQRLLKEGWKPASQAPNTYYFQTDQAKKFQQEKQIEKTFLEIGNEMRADNGMPPVRLGDLPDHP